MLVDYPAAVHLCREPPPSRRDRVLARDWAWTVLLDDWVADRSHALKASGLAWRVVRYDNNDAKPVKTEALTLE
jgi:hypothetical protein